MRKTTAVLGLIAALAVPATAAATPTDAHKQAAKAQCKLLRGKTEASREAFRAKYHGKARCIRRKAAEEHAEHAEAKRNAAKDCKAERDDANFPAGHDGKTFEEFYGTNANGRNAYGKCVSTKARAKKEEMDAEDEQDAKEFKNAAKECAAEREAIGREKFAQEYGTNENRRNAFGRCVSRKTRDL
jgi:hypothetical protein